MSLQDLTSTRNRVVPFLELDDVGPFLLYNKASMTNSACAICLDDFQGDFFVRVLPCHHGYCTACIGKLLNFILSPNTNQQIYRCLAYKKVELMSNL